MMLKLDTACRKCGNTESRPRWRASNNDMMITCSVCQFEWTCEPLDAQPMKSLKEIVSSSVDKSKKIK